MREQIINQNLKNYLSIKRWAYIIQIVMISGILYFGYDKLVILQGNSIYSFIGLGLIAFGVLAYYISRDMQLAKNVREKKLKIINLRISLDDVNKLYRRPKLKIKELNKSFEIIFGIDIDVFEGKKVNVVYDEKTKMILDIY